MNGSESNAHPLLRTRQARLERARANRSRSSVQEASRDITSDSSSVQMQPTSSAPEQTSAKAGCLHQTSLHVSSQKCHFATPTNLGSDIILHPPIHF